MQLMHSTNNEAKLVACDFGHSCLCAEIETKCVTLLCVCVTLLTGAGLKLLNVEWTYTRVRF